MCVCVCMRDVRVTCKQPAACPRTLLILGVGDSARQRSTPCGHAFPGSAGKGNRDGVTGG